MSVDISPTSPNFYMNSNMSQTNHFGPQDTEASQYLKKSVKFNHYSDFRHDIAIIKIISTSEKTRKISSRI